MATKANDIWRGHTEATLEGIAKSVDRIWLHIGNLPCGNHTAMLKVLWTLVLIQLTALIGLAGKVLLAKGL